MYERALPIVSSPTKQPTQKPIGKKNKMVRRSRTPLEKARRWKERAKNKDKCLVRRVLDIGKTLSPITEKDPVKQLAQVAERCREVVETFRSLLPPAWVEAYSGPSENCNSTHPGPIPYLTMGSKLGAGVFGTVYGASGPRGAPLAVKEQVISFKLGVKNFKDRLLR